MQTFRPPYHSASVSSTLAKLEVTSVFPTAICELNLCFLGLDRCTKYTKPSKTESKLVRKKLRFKYINLGCGLLYMEIFRAERCTF